MLTCSSCGRVSAASVLRSTPALPWLERGRRERRPFEGACDSAHSAEGVLLGHSVGRGMGKGMGTTRAAVPEVRTYMITIHPLLADHTPPPLEPPPLYPPAYIRMYTLQIHARTNTRTHARTHTPAQCLPSQHRGPPLHRRRLQNAPLPGLLIVQDHW